MNDTTNKMLNRLLCQAPYAENEDVLLELAIERASDLMDVFGLHGAVDFARERAVVAFDVPAIAAFWDLVEESIKYGPGEEG